MKKLFEFFNPQSFSYFLVHIIKLITSILCLKWIEPEYMAIWTIFLTFETYIMFFRFGVWNAFNREYSYLLGKGEDALARKNLNVTETFTLILCLIITIVCLGWALLFPIDIKKELNINTYHLYIIYFFYLIPKIYSGFIELTFRSSQDFKTFSFIQIVTAILLITSLPLVYYFGFYGYLYRIVGIGIVTLLLMIKLRKYDLVFDLDKVVFMQLFKDGIPLFISNYIQSILTTVPNILIIYFSSMYLLGIFYPASLVINFGALLPSIISIYLLPVFNFDFGKNNDSGKIINNSKRASLHSFIILMPFVLGGWFLVEPFTLFFIPEYKNSVGVMKMGLILSWLMSFNLLYNPFTVLKQWKPMYLFLIFSIIINILLPLASILIFKNFDILRVIMLSLVVAKVLQILFNLYLLNFIPSRNN